MNRTLTLFVLLCSCIACSEVAKNKWIYSINDPEEVHELQSRLKEISGIAFINEDTIGCIEDEHGILYLYSLSERKIIEEIKFSSGGDFEDITIAGDTIYILRSDGIIFEISSLKAIPQIRKLRVFPKGKRNVEGLFFMKREGMLLIADKENNSFWFFDLKKNKLNDVPIKIKKKNFSPSAIAIHPISGEMFILGTVDKSILIVTRDGTVTKAIKLQNQLFTQPEGIAFNGVGDLFISNEGRGGKSNILIFRYQKMNSE